ncbi:anhydro-N-acetylmuramic acid kinase [Cognatiyoonia koreensis]|uniref:Anhydro-N-acetylmuramic acid kinase n=1 Tax=Cognatiyoonia koreensis TaxID=364200 RepID=A0A1I0PIG5_9RHOB|nr:anhydro-N-acetylmuramic acid kinase [Cognatiyoonia koreensis]SEW14222.1 anhydro-N-acetylmuramic acid kinase [Cognatiyoonia koreensis]
MKITGPVRALGTMSGTSLDGVDAAIIVTNGVTIESFGASDYRPYSDTERDVIRAGFGQWGDLPEAAEIVETAHAQLLNRMEPSDLIGFHGQTVAHDPGGRGTHQIGDGQVLAEILQTPVIWDFRSADVQLGGQGAPLAPFYHFALAKWMKADAPVAFLNLGGVANITWIDPRCARPEQDGALLAFDTGPANAPLNDLMQNRLGQDCDREGALAARGSADESILRDFLADPFFYRMPPKSLDRDYFAHLSRAVSDLSDADAAATLTAAVAMSVSDAMQHCPIPPATVWVAGGGRKNPTMMQMLSATLDMPVRPVEDANLDGDMLEAQAFGYLAVRVARGLPTSCPGTTGVRAAVSGGTKSVPGKLAQVVGG